MRALWSPAYESAETSAGGIVLRGVLSWMVFVEVFVLELDLTLVGI